MKTKTRKPGWPKWAKYYAKDKFFGAYIYSEKPFLISNFWSPGGCRLLLVRNHHSSYRKTWCDSLRRIVEAKK